MSGVLQFLAKGRSSDTRSNEEPPRDCYILRVTGLQSFDLRLRMVVAGVRFSETRFIALDSPDDHSRCLFSTAAQIARLVARGVIVVCAIDLSHQTAKTLKFAMETLGISLSEIHLKSRAEIRDFGTPVAKQRCEYITQMPEVLVSSAPASSSPTPVVRALIRYLAARNQTNITCRDYNVLRSHVNAFIAEHFGTQVGHSSHRNAESSEYGNAVSSRRIGSAAFDHVNNRASPTTAYCSDFSINRLPRQRRWR
jgi:hypothetical protein